MLERYNKSIMFILMVVLMAILTACSCEHEWMEATCKKVRTCSLCGEQEGELAEHKWMQATCTSPKTCFWCGLEEGEPLEHKWEEATITCPMTCRICGETTGDVKKPTVEDIIDIEGIYCLHTDGTVSMPEELSESWAEEYVYSGAEPLVIDRAKGDQLIYTGDMVYISQYEEQPVFKMEWSCEKYYWSGKSVDFFDIEEFEGVDISGKYNNHIFLKFDTEEIFSPMGFVIQPNVIGYDGEVFILSKDQRSYSYGYYEGTEWYEETEVNDVPYYDLLSNGTEENDWEYVFKAPVIKGKEGYFTIDLSEVEAGVYYHDFDSGDFDEYIIEIK